MAQYEIPKSVSSYEDECAAVLSWLSADKWLTQHEFDRLSFAWRRPSGPQKARAVFMTEETIVPPFGSDLNLAILHEFHAAGIVEARANEGVIEYRLVVAA
jgi:hypothetical protein